VRDNVARVMRGGSWANGERFLRVANRNMQDSTTTSDLVGLRCAR
jgi:formylglycine-generating enzyme required for sulfatase activity